MILIIIVPIYTADSKNTNSNLSSLLTYISIPPMLSYNSNNTTTFNDNINKKAYNKNNRYVINDNTTKNNEITNDDIKNVTDDTSSVTSEFQLNCIYIDSINLWMNISPIISSLHYDTYHNILYVSTGNIILYSSYIL